MIQFAQEALNENRTVFGVKNASPLLKLKGFDIVYGFVPEYMHCVLAGVCKQYTESLLSILSKESIEIINKLMMEIKVPEHTGRLTRPLSKYNQYKAKEWENWLIYYSVPILSKILSKRRFQHWILFVEAVYIGINSHITLNQLNHANELLYQFVSKMEELFFINSMSYNVHQLLHLFRSIFNWGPLWAQSTFPFEAANHILLDTIHSARGVIQQVIRHVCLQKYIYLLEEKIYPSCSGTTLNFCKNVLGSRTKKVFKITNITYFGRGKSLNAEINRLANVSREAKAYTKIIHLGCLFATSEKINKRSFNYFAQLYDDRYVKIISFIVDFESRQELTICQIIKINDNSISVFCKEIQEYSSELVSIETSLILRICTVITVDKKSFIIAAPNMLSY